MEKKIKFGTDGWRAIIAKDFTVENVARVTESVVSWLKKNYETPSVVVGHDCRFAGELFVETIAKILVKNQIKVYKAKEPFVTTPMISFGTAFHKASLGIIITASHNPPAYNGYKLKGYYGGPLLPNQVQEIEDLIPNEVQTDFEQVDISNTSLCETVDLEELYYNHIVKSFDIKKIQNSGMKLAYDAMYGAGQRIMKRLFPNIQHFRCEYNPTFHGISPEPIMRNLHPFSEFIHKQPHIDCGLANDGDADRIGLMNGKGEYIDSHHIMLLLIHYLYKYKGYRGEVATGFSSTVKIKKLCQLYNLPLHVVPIGFKHICGLMLERDIIMGGEESGGIAVKGHIPERDGVWNGLVIWEFMAETGKTLDELIQEVYDLVGPFAFERIDLTLPEEQKQAIVENCKKGIYHQFGKYKVDHMEDLDGYKYIIDEDRWVMIRPSGTEPVLRTYAEGKNKEEALDILKATHQVILNT